MRGEHDGSTELACNAILRTCMHEYSCIISTHPQHNNKLKHVVPGSQACYNNIGIIEEGKAQKPLK